MRAELLRRLHEARVEAYALALFDSGPRPVDKAQELRFREHYRVVAEHNVTEYEQHNLFVAGAA